MIIELSPDTYFEHVSREGPLHVIMHYGATCGPCKVTMPLYEIVEAHFLEHNVTNVKFYKFHQWEPTHKQFIEDHNLKTDGVPAFRYYYMGDIINEETRSFQEVNELKRHITDTMDAISTTTGTEFSLHES